MSILKNKAIIIILLISVKTFAQNPALSTLPLIQTKDSSTSSAENNVINSDYEKLNSIFNKLVNARGDFRSPVPIIFLRKEEARVASIDYEKLQIIIEEKAFKICQPFGDGAVAFLLAHELTHYYEKHAWRTVFAADYADLKVGQNLKNIQDQLSNETQADYLGGFLAYSAGFNVFFNSEDILRQLYKQYNIEDLIPGYPSLNDRIELAKRSTKKLRSLIEIFEMANLLTATGKQKEAYAYYNYIIQQYQSREIYNNLGVTSLMNALQYFKEKELKYSYPIELDLETQGSRDASTIKLRDSLLRQSIKHFDASIGLDPNYAPAYLNKATALAILGDTLRAQFYAEQEAYRIAKKNNFPKTITDAKILLGILHARAGKNKEAKKLFNEAATTGSQLAKNNLNLLNATPAPKIKTQNSKQTDSIVMDHFDLNTFTNKPSYNMDKVITINPEFSFLQYAEDSLTFKIYFNLNTDTRDIHYFMLSKPECKAVTNKQIGIGSTEAVVLSNYGTPAKTIETPQGNILLYDNVLFIIDKDKQVSKWGYYLSKKSLL